ncbi:MAG: family 43 glycosylhydrolase, partial [Micrococcales bacterium]|nr:family 43 glycosylhydrolase [Micrococcales bacterium]
MTTTSHPLANPVIRGFAPDPSIIRVGTRYYVATSTFTWFPAIRLMMSDDLRTWSLAGHALDDQTALDLRELPANCGVFAPDLAYDPVLDRYTLAFSVVRSMVGDALDVEDWVLMAPHPAGPWSGLTYLGSIGIDPSIFYDDDGRAWLLALEWDPRAGYERPGAIVLEELDRHTLSPVGPTRRISRGGTDRGSVEGPHLYRHEGRYYLVTAEGGTGYGHCVAVARSTCIEGPYEADPRNPVLSAVPYRFYGRDRRDTWPCLEHYLPNAPLQKAGHASLVEAHTGQWFFAYLCSRPVDGAPVSSLGRETAVQEVTWTADGWLRLADGGREPQELTAGLDDRTYGPAPTTALIHDDFAGPAICPELMTPHQPLATLGASLNKRPGWMRLSGRRSLFSRADVALVAVR